MQTDTQSAESIILNILSIETEKEELLSDEIISGLATEYLSTQTVTFSEELTAELVYIHPENSEWVHEEIMTRLHNYFHRYKPTEKEAFAAQAETIIVKIDGQEFQTFLDENGTQRFRGNSVIRHLVDTDAADLNRLSIEFQNGKFSNSDWIDFYTSFGYSVGGLLDVSDFTSLDIENPLWTTDLVL